MYRPPLYHAKLLLFLQVWHIHIWDRPKHQLEGKKRCYLVTGHCVKKIIESGCKEFESPSSFEKSGTEL